MAQPSFIPISVRGRLDTANPPTDRPPGTLITATDLATKWWGPRLGGKQFAGVREMQDANLLGAYQNLLTFDGSNDYLSGEVPQADQRDLGTQWSLDVVFRPTDLDHPSTATQLCIFRWAFHTAIEIAVYIYGGTGANKGKVEAVIETTSVPGTQDDSVQILGTTQLTAGTDPEDIHHVRVVRDGKNAWVILDGAVENSTSDLTYNARHEGTVDGVWFMASADGTGAGTDRFFKGNVLRATLRTGKHTNVSSGFHDFLFSKNPSVKLDVRGTQNGKDYSRYGAHGVITGSPSAADSLGAPALYPIQGVNTFTDHNGVAWNVVVAGGSVYCERVN